MSRDEYIGAGEQCWIRTVGADPRGYYLHTEPSCSNILAGPGVPVQYALSAWAGKKPQCPVCMGIARNRLAEHASEQTSPRRGWGA
jgi:hypothetical protein